MTSIVHQLLDRELGVSAARQVTRSQTTHQVVNMQLSNYQDIEPLHSAAINSLDIDPVEQRYLLSGAGNGMVAVHDLHTIPPSCDAVQCTYRSICSTTLESECRHHGSVETVQWYPFDTGMFVSSGTDKLVKVWDTNVMRTVGDFKLSSFVFCHDMSLTATDHCLVAVACGESRVQLLDLKSGSATHMLRGHQKSVLAVRWSPREQFILATGGEDGRLLTWDVRSAKGCLQTFDQHNGDTSAGPRSVNTAHSGRIIGLRFLADGLRLVSLGSDRRLRVWDRLCGRNTLLNFGRIDVVGRTPVRMTTSPVDCGISAVFVPSGSDLLVLDADCGQTLSTLRGHYGRVNCAALSPVAYSLFTGANDRAILVWTAEETLYDHSGRRSDTGRHHGSSLGQFARRVGGGTADAWSSDEDNT